MQESLHSIQLKKLFTFILKLDLEKANDKIDWYFLFLILLHVGLSPKISSCIMSCVSTSSFVILVNGSPSPFFNDAHRVKQG